MSRLRPTRTKRGVGLERSPWLESEALLPLEGYIVFQKMRCSSLQSKVFDLAWLSPSHPTNAGAYGGVTRQQKLFELRRVISYRSGRGSPRLYDWGYETAKALRASSGNATE